MKVEYDNTKIIQEFQNDLERVKRIKNDLFILASRKICPRAESTIHNFTCFLTQFEIDLNEMIKIELNKKTTLPKNDNSLRRANE